MEKTKAEKINEYRARWTEHTEEIAGLGGHLYRDQKAYAKLAQIRKALRKIIATATADFALSLDAEEKQETEKAFGKSAFKVLGQ